MSACTFSQFDVLARILLDLPPSQPKAIAPGYFCMANLLGDIWLEQGTQKGDGLNLANLADSNELVSLIIYGKEQARTGRKMGHLITQAQDAERALNSAKYVRDQLKKLKASV